MSGYRPWDPPALSPDAPVSAPEDEQAPDAPYAPWQKKREAAPAAVVSKEFEAPPGLGDTAPARSGGRGMRLAAALLLWCGGFWLVAGVAAAAWAGGMAAFVEQHSEDPDPTDARELRAFQAAAIAAVIFLAVPALAGGVGVLYRQAWGKGIGIAAAVLQLLAVPFGTLLGLLALVLLARRDAAWWFR